MYIYLLQVLADNVDDLQKKGHAVEAANLKYSKFNATQIDVKADLKKSLIKTLTSGENGQTFKVRSRVEFEGTYGVYTGLWILTCLPPPLSF